MAAASTSRRTHGRLCGGIVFAGLVSFGSFVRSCVACAGGVVQGRAKLFVVAALHVRHVSALARDGSDDE